MAHHLLQIFAGKEEDALGEVYAEYLMGLHPGRQGVYELCPSFPAGISSFQANYHCVEVEWNRRDDKIEYQVTLPDGVYVTMAPPVGWKLMGVQQARLSGGNHVLVLVPQPFSPQT